MDEGGVADRHSPKVLQSRGFGPSVARCHTPRTREAEVFRGDGVGTPVATPAGVMLDRVETLKKEHGLLRVLLRACEGASSVELPGLLRQLHEAFTTHQRTKEQLYEDAAAVCRELQDASTLSLLSVFRLNLTVMSNAVLGFLTHMDPEPERLRQRFRSVSDALRSMMDVEEKSVFPICVRQDARCQRARSIYSQSLPPLRRAGGA